MGSRIVGKALMRKMKVKGVETGDIGVRGTLDVDYANASGSKNKKKMSVWRMGLDLGDGVLGFGGG